MEDRRDAAKSKVKNEAGISREGTTTRSARVAGNGALFVKIEGSRRLDESGKPKEMCVPLTAARPRPFYAP